MGRRGKTLLGRTPSEFWAARQHRWLSGARLETKPADQLGRLRDLIQGGQSPAMRDHFLSDPDAWGPSPAAASTLTFV